MCVWVHVHWNHTLIFSSLICTIFHLKYFKSWSVCKLYRWKEFLLYWELSYPKNQTVFLWKLWENLLKGCRYTCINIIILIYNYLQKDVKLQSCNQHSFLLVSLTFEGKHYIYFLFWCAACIIKRYAFTVIAVQYVCTFTSVFDDNPILGSHFLNLALFYRYFNSIWKFYHEI